MQASFMNETILEVSCVITTKRGPLRCKHVFYANLYAEHERLTHIEGEHDYLVELKDKSARDELCKHGLGRWIGYGITIEGAFRSAQSNIRRTMQTVGRDEEILGVGCKRFGCLHDGEHRSVVYSGAGLAFD